MGAEMEAYYPISALAHGQALNITVMSYAGGLYFGFTACHDRVPSVQRLAVYTGEALDELKRAFERHAKGGGGKASAPRTRDRRGGATRARRKGERAASSGKAAHRRAAARGR